MTLNCQGQLIYLRDPKEGWLTGAVVNAVENKVTVLTDDGQVGCVRTPLFLSVGIFSLFFFPLFFKKFFFPLLPTVLFECLHFRPEI